MKKSSMENFIFCVVIASQNSIIFSHIFAFIKQNYQPNILPGLNVSSILSWSIILF